MKPRTIPQKTSWLLKGTEQVMRPSFNLDDKDDDDDDNDVNDDDNDSDDNIHMWMYKTFTVTPHTDWQ